MIINAAAYIDGVRVDIDRETCAVPIGVDLHGEVPADVGPDSDISWNSPLPFVWVGLRMPDADELGAWCERLHVTDVVPKEVLAVHARPVLTVSGDTAQLVLRTVRYDEAEEIAMIGEVTIVATPRAIVTIRHGRTSPLGELRGELERDPERLRQGVTTVIAAVIGRVLEDYGPALDGFETDAVQVESEVFTATSDQPVRRLYKLKRELRRMLVAIESLEDPLKRMIRVLGPNASPEVLADLSEHLDQLRRTVSRGQSLSNLLDAVLTASLTQISVRQNDDMRKISAWVAMAAVPTAVAGIYGMNFDAMPELRWQFGSAVVLTVMAVTVALLYRSFKRSGWL